MDVHIYLHDRKPRRRSLDQTTAEYRQRAQEAERNLKWAEAARMWRAAIEAYPQSQRTGELYKRDISNMEQRAKEAENRAKASHDDAQIIARKKLPDGREITLKHVEEGVEAAGAGTRPTKEKWVVSVIRRDGGPGAGASFSTEAAARAKYDSLN